MFCLEIVGPTQLSGASLTTSKLLHSKPAIDAALLTFCCVVSCLNTLGSQICCSAAHASLQLLAISFSQAVTTIQVRPGAFNTHRAFEGPIIDSTVPVMLSRCSRNTWFPSLTVRFPSKVMFDQDSAIAPKASKLPPNANQVKLTLLTLSNHPIWPGMEADPVGSCN